MTDADDRARERVGSVLAEKWTLEALLGVGGMAAVYAARHRNGARAAIKILHPELARVPEIRERFLREGYAANRVEHEGAVQVLDDGVISSGPEAGAPYLVMELLEGESLHARGRRGLPLPEREALRIVDAVLDVLEAAHGKGVVHRDIKPENLFLPARGKPLVKVVDFGLARLMDRQGQTVHGTTIGTPAYMAPEQAAGRIDRIDARTDLFAVGATAFELLSGRTVHGKGDPLEIVMKVAKEKPPPLRSAAPDVHELTAKLVDRALAFEQADRYASAAEMRADVRRALEALEARDGASSPAEPATPSPEPVATTAAPRDAGSRAPEKRRRSLLPLAAALAYAVVALVVIGQRRGASPEPAYAGADAGATADLAPDAGATADLSASADAATQGDAADDDADADDEPDADTDAGAISAADLDAGAPHRPAPRRPAPRRPKPHRR